MTQDILDHGRRCYRPEPGPAFIPVEFQGAAYRFGHSMVRPSYRANLAGNADGTPFFGLIFDPAGEGQADPVDLRGGRRAPRRFIGWQTFFNFGGDQAQHVRPEQAHRPTISTPLFNLPLGAIASGEPPTSLPQRNLLRHLTWAIPSGQRHRPGHGSAALDRSQLQELAGYGVGLEASTPLWYYVLAEAELHRRRDPPRPGRRPHRRRGLHRAAPARPARLPAGPAVAGGRPCPARRPGTFMMTDLLRFARVDPASRGQ